MEFGGFKGGHLVGAGAVIREEPQDPRTASSAQFLLPPGVRRVRLLSGGVCRRPRGAGGGKGRGRSRWEGGGGAMRHPLHVVVSALRQKL